MNTTIPLLKKEMLEQWRTNKLIIAFVAFVITGLQGPVIAKILPDIIKNAGGSMKGMQIIIPKQTSLDAILSFFNSMATMPALIMILLAMGSIAGERERGTLVFMLTKPVSRTSVILTKYFTYLAVVVGATLLSALVSGYYTILLFDSNFEFGNYFLLNLTMIVFEAFLLAIIILASSLFKSGIAAGGISLLAVLVFTTVIQFLPDYQKYSPQAVFSPTFGRELMTGIAPLSDLLLPNLVGIALSALVLAVACFASERREI
jgi:ABC-2 type transport system permease protein